MTNYTKKKRLNADSIHVWDLPLIVQSKLKQTTNLYQKLKRRPLIHPHTCTPRNVCSRFVIYLGWQNQLTMQIREKWILGQLNCWRVWLFIINSPHVMIFKWTCRTHEMFKCPRQQHGPWMHGAAKHCFGLSLRTVRNSAHKNPAIYCTSIELIHFFMALLLRYVVFNRALPWATLTFTIGSAVCFDCISNALKILGQIRKFNFNLTFCRKSRQPLKHLKCLPRKLNMITNRKRYCSMDVREKKAIQDEDFTTKYTNNREHSGWKRSSRDWPRSKSQL